jgi:hypothetical protein
MKRALLGLLLLVSVSCGDMVRQGTGSSYLSIERLEAASGAKPDEFDSVLASDLVTVVDDRPTIFEDVGRVRFALRMKDPGSVESPTAPSPANAITINRYHVRYFRADGHNRPGIDVPHPFDGAFTITVSETAEATFTLVRIQAKREAPLSELVASPAGVLSTIAEVTFYGYDQAGREVIVKGNIGIDFANWGDPE